jgi:LuxR family maltose regulon positive regulatory protein
MPAPILATKLYIPPTRPNAVLRPRLVERMNAGSKLLVLTEFVVLPSTIHE